MATNHNLGLKCFTMGFSELESFKNLANYTYRKMIAEAETPDDAKGLENEIDDFNTGIDKIIANRVISIIAE